MSGLFEIDTEKSNQQYVYIKVIGSEIDSYQLAQIYIAARETMHQFDANGMLIDLRNVSIVIEPYEAVEGFKDLKDEGWFKGIRLARLIQDDTFYHDFVATLVERLGLPVQNFIDEQQAIEWLLTCKKADLA